MRDSRFACSRVNSRASRRRQRGAVARDAGDQRGGLGDAQRQAVDGTGVAGAAPLGPAVGERPSRRSRRSAPRPWRAAPRGGARSGARSGSRRSPAGRRRGRRTSGAARVEGRSSSAITAALADQQGRRGAGVDGHLEALPRLGVELAPSASRRARGGATRWAELDTGSSSAGPWTIPSAAAARRIGSGARSARRLPRARRLALGGGLAARPRRAAPRRRRRIR